MNDMISRSDLCAELQRRIGSPEGNATLMEINQIIVDAPRCDANTVVWHDPEKELPEFLERVWVALKSHDRSWVTDTIYMGAEGVEIKRGAWDIPIETMGKAKVYAWASMIWPGVPEEERL